MDTNANSTELPKTREEAYLTVGPKLLFHQVMQSLRHEGFHLATTIYL